jgi:hypothetical protein
VYDECLTAFMGPSFAARMREPLTPEQEADVKAYYAALAEGWRAIQSPG